MPASVTARLASGLIVLAAFIVIAIPFRALTAWMYNRTGSLFLVGLLHAVGDATTNGSFAAGFLPRLYEHADARQGFHPDWKSFIFNYDRNEVRSFLLSSALFWLRTYHADGLREKLNHQPDHHQRGDHILQPEQTENDSQTSHHKQRHIRKPMFRMNPGKRFEVVAIDCGGVRKRSAGWQPLARGAG